MPFFPRKLFVVSPLDRQFSIKIELLIFIIFVNIIIMHYVQGMRRVFNRQFLRAYSIRVSYTFSIYFHIQIRIRNFCLLALRELATLSLGFTIRPKHSGEKGDWG